MNLQPSGLSLAAFTLFLLSCISQGAESAEASGQYFQFGSRGGPAKVDKGESETVVTVGNDQNTAKILGAHARKAEPFFDVIMQIDFGTQELCESRLAIIAKSKEVADAFGSGAFWCSPNSASQALKYHGIFRNRVNGRTFHIESEQLGFCTMAAEAMTGGQAASNKIEVTQACQAR